MTEEVEVWATLEALGHQKTAGRYYYQNGLHRIDIPDTSSDADPDTFVRTELYGENAIFRITFVDEQTARIAVAQWTNIPAVITWEMKREMQKLIGPSEPVALEAAYEAEYPGDPFDEEELPL